MTARAWAASALIYAAITAVLGRDLLAQLGSAIANDPGDPLLNAAILHWNAHHVPWTDRWWQFPIFHPTRDALAFSEYLLGVSVIASPITWLTGNSLTSYNVTTLLTFPLSAMAMFALVAYLTRDGAAAFIAGLAYGFAPYRIAQLAHLQMLAAFWAPLALLGLHAYLRSAGRPQPGRLGWLVLYAIAWALQTAANAYMLVIFSLFVGLWTLWFVVARRRWRDLGAIAVATAVGAVPLAPILYTYVSVHARHGFARSIAEMEVYSADVAAVLCAPSGLTFWGWLRVACRAEGELFPGLALFAICVVAAVAVVSGRPAKTAKQPLSRLIILVRRVLLVTAASYALVVASVLLLGPWDIDAGFVRVSASDIDKPLLVALSAAVGALLLSLGALAAQDADAFDGPGREPGTGRATIGFYLFGAVITWLFALGPTVTLMGEPSGRPGPFMLLLPLPGVDGLRVPARFWLMTVLCMATVAGLFLARVLPRTRVRGALVALCAILLAADGWSAPIAAPPAPAPVPQPDGLRGEVVLHLPAGLGPDMAATWRAARGGWRTVNGYSGHAPIYYDVFTQAAAAGEDELFQAFRQEHDLHVVVQGDEPRLRAAVERQPGAVLTGRGADAVQYRLPRLRAVDPSATAALSRSRLDIEAVRSPCAAETLGRIVDGSERTRWDCAGAPNSQVLTIELEEPGSVGAITYVLGPHSWNVPMRLAIETSLDGEQWIPAREDSIVAELIEGGLRHPGSLRATLPFEPRRARFVRVRPVETPPEFVWWVSEVEVRP